MMDRAHWILRLAERMDNVSRDEWGELFVIAAAVFCWFVVVIVLITNA